MHFLRSISVLCSLALLTLSGTATADPLYHPRRDAGYLSERAVNAKLLARDYYVQALRERGLDDVDPLSYLPRRSPKILQKRWDWHKNVDMGHSDYSDTQSIGTAGLESCIGVAIAAKTGTKGKIIGHIKPVGYQAQIATLKALIQTHAGTLKGAVGYVRVRESAGSESPPLSGQIRAQMEKAVTDMLKELKISAGRHKSPAGGTGQSGQMWINAENTAVKIDGHEYKL